MASDIAEKIMDIAEERDSQKEFIVAQMRYDYPDSPNASRCVIGCRTGGHKLDNCEDYRQTSLEELLNIGWRIEREFVVSKTITLNASKAKCEEVLVNVQHFIMSKTRQPAD